MQEQTTPCACGCGRALSSRAGVGARFVRGHYWRVQNRPFGVSPRTPLEVRFWGKVEKTDGCWLWSGAITSRGYGSINLGKRGVTDEAHRVSWRLHFGEIPTGMWVLHRCDIRACIRPEHLFLGNNAENMTDMWTKGRGVLPRRQPSLTERARGERSGPARLTEQAVRDIRSAYASGSVSQEALALHFGVGQNAISRVVRRVSWQHVP